MTERNLNDTFIQNRQQAIHHSVRRSKVSNIRKRLRDDNKNYSVIASPLVMMLCLLMSSYTSTAYSPVINHPYPNTRAHHVGMSKVHPPTQLQKQTQSGTTISDGSHMTFIEDRDSEVTGNIPIIRKLSNMSQLYDFAILIDQHNSTDVAEITHRFAHLLSYNNGSTVGARTGSQTLTTNNAEHSDEGDLLSVVLSLIISTFNNTRYQHTKQYQYHFDCADCFVGLTNVLQNFIIRDTIKNRQQDVIIAAINQLWNHVIEYEEKVQYSRKQSIVHNMSPKKLVSLFLSIHKVNQYASPSIMMRRMNTSSLVYTNVCTRLCHGDRINRLNVNDIYQTLKALDLSSSTSSLWNVCKIPETQQLLIGLLRRIRKPTIYTDTSSLSLIIKALHQMQRLWYSIKANSSSNATFETYSTNLAVVPTMSRVTREIELSMYRLLCHIIISTSLPNTVNQSDTTTCRRQISVKELGILAMTIRIVIPRTFISNTTHEDQQNDSGLMNSNIPAIVQRFQQLVTVQASMTKLPKSMCSTQRVKIMSIRDISRILSTWEYYQCHDIIQHAEDVDSHRSNHQMIQSLGLLTEHIVVEGTNNNNAHDMIRPTDVNNIYRKLAFLPKSYPTQSFCLALGYLLRNDNFLQRCSTNELSNFCWFMAFKSHHCYTSPNDSVIIALGNRIIQPDVCHDSSPKEAIRILTAFTRLCCHEKTTPLLITERPDKNSSSLQQQKLSSLLSSVFKCYGEYLLESADLSPYEASSAIYAYAKAQYVLDMGIFDHLVDIFATHIKKNNPSYCTLRQICQTLWACGKMVSLESFSINEIDAIYAENKDPPYYNGFLVMVAHVIRYAENLSKQDVTQTLWAISHFNLFLRKNVKYDIAIEPILHQVQTLATAFNANERATLLWTFSRVPAMSPLLAKTIFLLTRPFAKPIAVEQCTDIMKPEVASIILYSLGRMNIRDTEVFTYLTDYVFKYQINTASAQTIANILWAHRSVHIEPPQELFESWTLSKLPNLNIANRIRPCDRNSQC